MRTPQQKERKLSRVLFVLLLSAVCIRQGSAQRTSHEDSPFGILGSTEKAPIYIYVFAHTEDHINLDLSEERFRRLFPLIERYAIAYPQYGLSWSVQFYGADTQTLLERNPQNIILDFILSYRDKGFVEFGYHGAHEPTYTNNPLANLPRDASWEQTVEAGLQFLSCAKHPYLGGVDCSKSGGLALVQQVFGAAAAVSGIGGNPAIQHAIDQLNANSIMFGFSDHGPATERPGYREGVKELMRLLSPKKDTPPELFWMDGRLRVNDGNPLDDVHHLVASQGVESVKQEMAKLDRSRPHVLNMIVGDKFIYARASPTDYAYAHPESPQLPLELSQLPQDKEARYRRTEETLKYLVEELFPQNLGSRFVSNKDLLQMAAGPKYGQSVSIGTAEAIARALIVGWTDRPPPFIKASEAYFTLAESFELLTLALGEYAQRQSFPAYVPFYKVIGPLERVGPSPQEMGATTIEILTRASDLAAQFKDRTWKPMPSFMIPSTISVGASLVNAAEFLRLMADLFVALKEGQAPGSVLLVPSESLPGSSEIYARVGLLKFPGGILWSLKPAKILTPKSASPRR